MGSCMNAASSVTVEQSASPGDNKSQPADQLCWVGQYGSQVHIGILAGISSDRDEQEGVCPGREESSC